MKNTHSTSGDSGIEGEIILRPISPIERTGTTNHRSYQATVTVLDKNGQMITQFQSDAAGHFRISLPPGEYTLRPESPRTYPRAVTQTITVATQAFTHVIITYDTGIRTTFVI